MHSKHTTELEFCADWRCCRQSEFNLSPGIYWGNGSAWRGVDETKSIKLVKVLLRNLVILGVKSPKQPALDQGNYLCDVCSCTLQLIFKHACTLAVNQGQHIELFLLIVVGSHHWNKVSQWFCNTCEQSLQVFSLRMAVATEAACTRFVCSLAAWKVKYIHQYLTVEKLSMKSMLEKAFRCRSRVTRRAAYRVTRESSSNRPNHFWSWVTYSAWGTRCVMTLPFSNALNVESSRVSVVNHSFLRDDMTYAELRDANRPMTREKLADSHVAL